MGRLMKVKLIIRLLLESSKKSWILIYTPFDELKTIYNDDIEFTPMTVKLRGGKAKLLEHQEIKFVDKKEFFKMDLTPLSKKAGRTLFDSYGFFFKKGEVECLKNWFSCFQIEKLKVRK